jgi:hypothetical protein
VERQILKIEELLVIMNSELSRFDTCVECRFKSIVPLKDADEEGCNWSHANLNCRAFPASVSPSAALCQPAAVCRSGHGQCQAQIQRLVELRLIRRVTFIPSWR